jgi:tRNA nucleotidyltransferase (CCA-adding enzyme)
VRWTALLATLPEAAVDSLCKRLRAPTEYRELALLATRLRIHLHGAGRDLAAEARDPAWLLSLLEEADAFRRPERYRLWLQVLQSRALAAGVPNAQAAALACRLQDAQEAAQAVKLDAATVADMDGPAVAALLRERRLAALKALPAP